MGLNPDVIDEREKSFVKALMAEGVRMTPQRLEIIRQLAGSDGHPDADAVFRAVRDRMPTLSHDTVYRTLAVLVKCGLAERIEMPRASRYDPDGTPHHHFICERCARVVDIRGESAQAYLAPNNLLGIGDVRSVRVEFRGVCSTCQD